MVGFLVAGFAYNIAGLEVPTGLQTIADLGVTLLLFSIGFKLKLKDLSTIEVWGTSVIHILATTSFFTVFIMLGKCLFSVPLFELSLTATIILAFGLSFSSTVFAVKFLEDNGDIGALILGILIEN